MDDGRSISMGRGRPVATRRLLSGLAFSSVAALAGCGVPNNPNPPGSEATNTYFTATQESSPKYLDPTSSDSENETPFVSSIYEPLLGYHYLKRPYELI